MSFPYVDPAVVDYSHDDGDDDGSGGLITTTPPAKYINGVDASTTSSSVGAGWIVCASLVVVFLFLV